MPRKRNLRANKSNKNRYGEPLFGSVTPRKKTPKRVTPIRFTRTAYTPAKIPPNNAQRKKPEPPQLGVPGYSFLTQKQWKKYRITQANKNKTEAQIKEKELPEVKKQEKKKRSKN